MTEWIVSSCLVILVVLALRAGLGRRLSARFRYALWALVLVRLLLPVQLFTSPVAGLQVSYQTPEILREESFYVLPVQSIPAAEASYVEREGDVIDSNSFGYARLENGGETLRRYAFRVSLLEVLGWLWLAGALVWGGALLVSNFRFAARLRRVRRPLEGTGGALPVYVAEGVPSPCLFGLLRPAVYVTPQTAADPAMLRHVKIHELTHYRHLDHLWSVLRGVALAVHWWNPLVWLAVALSRRDGEMACDEGALRQLGDGERLAYGETLLTLVTAKAGPRDLLSCATTMTGGKKDLKERVRRIACKQKVLVSASVAVALLLCVTVICAFGRKEDNVPAPDSTAAPLGEDSWQTAEITVDASGIPHIRYAASDGGQELTGNPVPAPREWADQDLAGRDQATALENASDTWAKLVSATDGWLVACYGRGVAAADTYVYRTEDGGMNWTEVTMPGVSWHIADVGFLSPERLIVAQRLFDGAPCFLTRDGGETWEPVELWDGQVLSIAFDGMTVSMEVGPHEGDPPTYTMLSYDLGDTWTTDPSGPNLGLLLPRLEASDIGDISGQSRVTAEALAALLRDMDRSRTSRFHEYDRFPEEETWIWTKAEWTVPLTGAGTLHLIACESGGVEIAYETEDGSASAFYDSQDLYDLICAVGETFPVEELPYEADLNHDGSPDRLTLRSDMPNGTCWCLQCYAPYGDGSGLYRWDGLAYTAHMGWNSYYLCRLDGQDYLLEYAPYMSSGICMYQYKLFYLEDGREVVVQENSMEFDINFGRDFAGGHHLFEPRVIAAFMEEINGLLANSTLLLNTDGELLYTFEKEGRLYDSLWFLDDDVFTRDESKSLLENLIAFQNHCTARAAVPSVSEVLTSLQAENIRAMHWGGAHLSYNRDKNLVADTLNGLADSVQYLIDVEGDFDRNSALVTYVQDSGEDEYTILLEIGEMEEAENLVRITCEGVVTFPFYSENPDNEGTYLHSEPYSVTAYVEDETLYRMVYCDDFLWEE